VNPDALVGTQIQDLLGPDLYALNEPHIRGVLQGEEQLFERIVPGPGGARRHSLAHYMPDIVDGEVAGFMVQVTEVTQLKEAEATLRAKMADCERAHERLSKSEAALRQAQRLGQVGSWEWEIAPDLTTWSDELYRILDCDPRRLPPSFAEHPKLYTPESWSALGAAVEHTRQTGEPYTLELEYVRQDGSTGWIEARGEAVRDEGGEIFKLRGTAIEITLRRHVEEARLQRDLADAANRNKTQFLSRVSHELRTPLNGILGFAQLLQRDAEIGPKQKRWADVIVCSGSHMLDLVDEILDLSGAELGQIAVGRVTLDLGEIVRECLSQFSTVACDAGVELVNRMPSIGILSVLADRKRLRQVINNLLSNAIKYNHAGGRITLSSVDRGTCVEMCVEDTGVGMSADQLSRLFIPFERLGAERTGVKGTGVGLALTKKLVDMMGGSLRVESQPGKGSRFIVSFATGIE
jgi:signal transduction histidine kinase